MSDKIREAFEAWHRSKFATKYSTGQPTRDMHNGVYDDDYGPQKQQQMWEAWQAALAHQSAPVAVPDGFVLLTAEQIARHALTAAECAPQSKVLLVSSIKRLHDKNAEAAAPAAPVAVGRGPVDRHYPNEEMDAIAVSRYRVGSSGAGTLHRHAVRAGDGEQELWRGSESDCKLVARKLAGAFLDGGLCLHALLNVAPPAAEQLDTVKVRRALLDELAGDLAAEVEARYPDKDHPALKHKYERDMRPVLEARALLAGGGA